MLRPVSLSTLTLTLAAAALLIGACGSSPDESGGSSEMCIGLLPIGTANCPESPACCQTGPDVPVGGGCVNLGTTTLCVPRCNTSSDCASGSCCVHNPSSVPALGHAPVEPGGWCLGESLATSGKLTCMSGDGNGYVCTGNGNVGYSCSTALP